MFLLSSPQEIDFTLNIILRYIFLRMGWGPPKKPYSFKGSMNGHWTKYEDYWLNQIKEKK